jgi:hypothetical protein
MSRFINLDYPMQHGAVVRLERSAQVIRKTAHRFSGARGAATLLLAAIASALLVVANELVETWTDGHLMVAWVALWAIGFAALVLFAEPARDMVAGAGRALKAWSAARKERAEDEKLWKVALTDARVMADLSRAMGQQADRDIRAYY